MSARRLTFEECHSNQGVTRCEDCEVYEKCCEYGAEKREELGCPSDRAYCGDDAGNGKCPKYTQCFVPELTKEGKPK
jgi:hypothetical protein